LPEENKAVFKEKSGRKKLYQQRASEGRKQTILKTGRCGLQTARLCALADVCTTAIIAIIIQIFFLAYQVYTSRV
jgi:hypothetical protein